LERSHHYFSRLIPACLASASISRDVADFLIEPHEQVSRITPLLFFAIEHC